MVGLAVAAGIEAVAGDLPRGRRERRGGAQVRPGGLGAEPLGVIPGRDEQEGRGVGTDPVEGQKPGSVRGDKRDDELIEARQLGIKELGAPAQLAQREPGGVADGAAGAGPQRGQAGDQGSGGVAGKAGAQVIGPVKTRDRAWLIVWVRSERALRLATISARIASTAPSRPFGAPRARPDWAARAALTASRGSDLPWRRRSWRSDRSTSTTRMPAAVTCRDKPAP